MSDHDDLGELLQRIAATVGDPPEHGLERVDARRRRRTRHRRGAVAAAVALAVGGVAVSAGLSGLGEGTNVTTGTASGDETEPMMPDVVELNCSPAGIEIPIGSIQTQRDGLHVVIYNGFLGPTEVWVRGGDSWYSGRVPVDPGASDITQPVPPGDVTLGCNVGGTDQERGVILVDDDNNYEEPELACPEDEQLPLQPGTFEPTPSTFEAGRFSMGSLWDEDEDQVQPVTGYRDESYGYKSTVRVVRVDRDGEPFAFVHLQDESPDDDKPARAPWAGISEGSYCPDLVEDHAPPDTTTTSSVTPPPSS